MSPREKKISWNAKIPYDETLMPTNPFGGKKLYINSLDNALFSADKKFWVTATIHNVSDDSLYSDVTEQANKLFNGSYEDGIVIPQGDYYLKVHIQFNEAGTATFNGYPYGTFYASYYYTYTPASTKYRCYNTYEGHGVGWKELDFTDYIGTNGSGNYVQSCTDLVNYGRTQIEFYVYAHAAHSTTLSELEWKLSRPNLSRDGSTVTKYGINKLYYNLVLGTNVANNITLSPTGTIDALSFVENSQLLSNKYSLIGHGHGEYASVSHGHADLESISNKITILNSSSTNTQYPGAKATYDAIENVREVAEGKKATYVVSYATNANFNSQNDFISLTGSITDVNSQTITLNDFKLGDSIYVTEVDVPDRWVSSITGEQGFVTSITLDKLETAKVPLTDIKINGTTVVSNNIANLITNGSYSATNNKIATMSDIPDVSVYVLKTRKINGKELSSDVNLKKDDIDDLSVTLDGVVSYLPTSATINHLYYRTDNNTLYECTGHAEPQKMWAPSNQASYDSAPVKRNVDSYTMSTEVSYLETAYPAINENIGTGGRVRNTNLEYAYYSLTTTLGSPVWVAKGTPKSGTFYIHNNTTYLYDGTRLSGKPVTDVRINGTTIVSNNVANFITKSSYNATSNKIATINDIPTDLSRVGSNNSTSKLFLIGTADQTLASTSYSNAEIYATDGVLTTKGVSVGGGSATIKYDATSKSIKFIFT